jgi:hypothetical protein
MLIRAVICAFALTCPLPAAAQALMFEYYTSLSPTDAFNSRGEPLDDFCAIVQQDRANWHRFLRRDDGDQGDPFFDTTEKRGQIAGRCTYDRNYYANPGRLIRSGQRYFYVYVRVYGTKGQVTEVLVTEGAG